MRVRRPDIRRPKTVEHTVVALAEFDLTEWSEVRTQRGATAMVLKTHEESFTYPYA